MKHKSKTGFTIIELMMVIVIIAILAVLTIVTYQNVSKRALDAVVRNDLAEVTKKLDAYRVDASMYPADLATAGISSDDDAIYQYTLDSASGSYCLSVTSPKSTTLAYHVTSTDRTLQDGVCDGHNPPSGSVPNFATTVNSGGPMNFSVTSSQDWSSVTFHWNAVSGVARYEIMSRGTATGSWLYRLTADGSSNCSGGCYGTWSGNVPSAATSLTWTSGASVPKLAGNHFEYRIRSYDGTSYSDWETVILENYFMDGSKIPAITGFTASLGADWSNMTLHWNKLSQFAPDMSQVYIEIMSRTSTTGSWLYRVTADGSSDCSGGCYGTWSGNISNTSTSLTWTNATSVPKLAGNAYEYKIRIRVAGAVTYYGPWTTVSLANPIQSGSSIPYINNFAVAHAADWSNITLSWNAVPQFVPDMSQVFVEIMSRTSTTGSWLYRVTTDGSSSCSGGCYGTWSGAVPNTTTSLTWTSSIPIVGSTYQYEARVRVTGASTYYGNWSVVSLSR